MSTFTQYRRTQIAEMTPWTPNVDMTRVLVSAPDKEAGSPKAGDMIARNPKNHDGQWLVAAKYFADNFAALEQADVRDELVAALAAITDQLERVGDARPGKDGPFIEDARAALTRAGWKP